MSYKPSWGARSYSEEEFVAAWTNSKSLTQCARTLNLVIYGATNKTLKSTAKYLGLTDDHMLGQGWNRKDQPNYVPLSANRAKPIEHYLVEDGTLSSYGLKVRLLREGLLTPRCSAPYCQNPDTIVDGLTGDTIATPLKLDHINGVNNDNRLENLRLLCHNCDAVNPTYCRGSGNRATKLTYAERAGLLTCSECGGPKMKTAIMCTICRGKDRTTNPQGFLKAKPGTTYSTCSCGNRKAYGSARCADCYHESTRGILKPGAEKISWPSDGDLVEMLSKSNFLQLGKKLGVSDNAIRKRMKKRGLL